MTDSPLSDSPLSDSEHTESPLSASALSASAFTNEQLVGENYRVGSEYLVANAFAYLAYGLTFDNITLDVIGGGQVNVPEAKEGEKPIAPLVNSCVTLAGLVVELRWDADHQGFDVAMPARMALWTEMAESDESSSVHNIDAQYILEALTWALAFVEANAELIAANGTRLRDAGGHLDLADFRDQASLIVVPTQEQRRKFTQVVLPYATGLLAIGFANKARAALAE
jgi:hypothetical protein